jgi:hypothetical protein
MDWDFRMERGRRKKELIDDDRLRRFDNFLKVVKSISRIVEFL